MRQLFAALIGAAFGAALLVPSQADEPPPGGAQPKPPVSVQQKIQNIRAALDKGKHKFTVGQTAVSDKDLNKITGAKPPPPNQLLKQAQAQRLKAGYDHRAIVVKAGPPPLEYDWRSVKGKSLAVQSQGDDCGCCWAFAAIGAYEHSFLHRNLGPTVNASEQQVLNCVKPKLDPPHAGCDGGWHADAFELLVRYGTATRTAVPYQARDDIPCDDNVPRPYKANRWAYVNASNPTSPGDDALKAALMEFGPLAIGINVGPTFQQYTGGVFTWDEAVTDPDKPINHDVTLMGWSTDKQAWLIRNSWGANWGESGYMWIRYGMSQVGFGACWVEPAGSPPNGDGGTPDYLQKIYSVSTKDRIAWWENWLMTNKLGP
jgi:cathepsin L